jgi:hypothetical protein
VTVATTYEIHPLALRVPAMTDEEFAALRSDIEANGLQRPITLYEGKVLDGRHRQRACEETGVWPVYDQYEGDRPAAFVLSLNAKRRNLTSGQLAMLATDFLPDLEAEAHERRVRAGQEHGRGMDSSAPDGAGLSERVRTGRASTEAAELVGASPRNVQRAKRIAEGDPELAERVRAGEVSIHAADDIVAGREATRDGSRKRPATDVASNVFRKLAGFVPALREVDLATAITDSDAPLAEWDKQLTDVIQTLSRIRGDIRKEMNQ